MKTKASKSSKDENAICKKFFLIGMMGSGKSYWAEQLKRKTKLQTYDLDALIDLPNLENTLAFFDLIREFREWPKNLNGWSAQFVIDSELTWQSGHVAVDDV